jgi:hypothetical protein
MSRTQDLTWVQLQVVPLSVNLRHEWQWGRGGGGDKKAVTVTKY